MPVVATHLTTGTSATDATSWNTASISPTGNYLVLAFVAWAQSTPGTPSMSGNNLTWVQLGTTEVQGSRAGATFRAMGSPTAGAATITITGGTGTPSRAGWSITEFTNVDTTGTNGSGAVVQYVDASSASANSLTVTLADFGSVDNATFGGTMLDTGNGITNGTGFTELGQSNEATEGFSVESQWRNDNDTSVDWTYGATTTVIGGAVEIKFAEPPAPIVTTGFAFII